MNANLSSFKVLAFIESFHFVRKNTFENHCTPRPLYNTIAGVLSINRVS